MNNFLQEFVLCYIGIVEYTLLFQASFMMIYAMSVIKNVAVENSHQVANF